jgi:hypothetical protein
MGSPVSHLLVGKVAKKFHEKLSSKEYYQKDGIKTKKIRKDKILGKHSPEHVLFRGLSPKIRDESSP